MNTTTVALTLSATLMALPLVAGWFRRRPITELDRRLSAVDVELDALRA